MDELVYSIFIIRINNFGDEDEAFMWSLFLIRMSFHINKRNINGK